MFVAEALVDSDSGSLLTAELSRTYAEHAGTAAPPGLPEVSDASYLDYVESCPPNGAAITSSRAYWVRQAHQIAIDARAPTMSHNVTTGSAMVAFTLMPSEWDAVVFNAHQLGLTPYVVVLTSLQVALAHVTERTQYLVHTIVPQRIRATESLIGNSTASHESHPD